MKATQNITPVSHARNHLSDMISIMFSNFDWTMIKMMSRLTFIIRFIHLGLLIALIYHVFFKPVHVFKDGVYIKWQVRLIQ